MLSILFFGIKAKRTIERKMVMKQETKNMLNEFNLSPEEELQFGDRYKVFEDYIKQMVSGEGMVGDSSYLLLWEKREIEELNNGYETQEFLSNILFIGSDGGDMAYGIDVNGRYIEISFIGMADEEAKTIAEDFDGFIEYVWNKE